LTTTYDLNAQLPLTTPLLLGFMSDLKAIADTVKYLGVRGVSLITIFVIKASDVNTSQNVALVSVIKYTPNVSHNLKFSVIKFTTNNYKAIISVHPLIYDPQKKYNY
jgi:hypothetical protein